VQHVEELPAQHLGAHRLPRDGQPGGRVGGQAGRADHVVGPGQRQVAEQDRGGGAEPGRRPAPVRVGVPAGELDVHRRLAAPGGRGVHQVVVDERARLQQLQRADRAHHGRRRRAVLVAARAPPAPPGEQGAHPLAAVEHEPGQGAGGVGEPRVDVPGQGRALVQERRELGLDRLDQALVGPDGGRGRDQLRRAGHGEPATGRAAGCRGSENATERGYRRGRTPARRSPPGPYGVPVKVTCARGVRCLCPRRSAAVGR
jgi:hypothetical protein